MTEGVPLTTMFYPNCPRKSVGLVVPNTLLKVSFFCFNTLLKEQKPKFLVTSTTVTLSAKVERFC